MRRYLWILSLCCVVGTGGAIAQDGKDVEEIKGEAKAPQEQQAPQPAPEEGGGGEGEAGGGGQQAQAGWPDVTYNQDIAGKSAEQLLEMIKALPGCPSTLQTQCDLRKNWLFHHDYQTTLGTNKTLHYKPSAAWARIATAFRMGQQNDWNDALAMIQVDQTKDKQQNGWAAAETNSPAGSARHYLNLIKQRATSGPPNGAPNATLATQIATSCDKLINVGHNASITDQVAYARVLIAYYAALVGDDHYYLCRDELNGLE